MLLAAALAVTVAGCGQSKQAASEATPSAAAASPVAQGTNPTDFPLYTDAALVTSKSWHVTSSGKSYAGTEIVAKTPASLQQLGTWIEGLSKAPPAGYTVTSSGSSVDAARRRAAEYGIDFQGFSHQVGGKTHELIVLAIDPQTFDARAGSALSMLDRYALLPQSMRDAIDNQVKSHTGYTVTDMLNPDTPIGAAVSAVKQLRDSGQRGVVVVDAARQ